MSRPNSRGKTPGSKERAGGVKPAIAFAAEQAALDNIQRKLGLLVQALNGKGPLVEENGELRTVCLPFTLRQFNLWSSVQLPLDAQAGLGQFGPNGNKTLRQC